LLIDGQLRWTDAIALRDVAMTKNFSGERGELRKRLKDAVQAFNGRVQIERPEYTEAFAELSCLLVGGVGCRRCLKVFSRRDARTRHEKKPCSR
jgi:hypothetical protein